MKVVEFQYHLCAYDDLEELYLLEEVLSFTVCNEFLCNTCHNCNKSYLFFVTSQAAATPLWIASSVGQYEEAKNLIDAYLKKKSVLKDHDQLETVSVLISILLMCNCVLLNYAIGPFAVVVDSQRVQPRGGGEAVVR